ncbi:MAG: hypothetical protein K2K57_00020 [Oscillospiraceae bacterium]|nr:hypothetical protein [Oscillospiraceae bacterium]
MKKQVFKYTLIYIFVITLPLTLYVMVNYGGMAFYELLKKMPKEQLKVFCKVVGIISPCSVTAIPAMLTALYFRSKKRKKEIIRQSEERGTFIVAHLIKKEYMRRHMEYRCIYGYSVNGKTRDHLILLRGQPPEELKLYPKNSAGTAFFSDFDSEGWIAAPLIGLSFIILLVWNYMIIGVIEFFEP